MTAEQAPWRRVATAFSLGSGQAVVRLACSFLSIKLTAVYLGPAGLAMVSQFNTLVTLGQGVLGAGLATAVVRLTPEYASSPDRQANLWRTAMRLAIYASVLGMVLVLLLAGPLAQRLFQERAFTWAAAICGVAIAASLLNTVLLGILNGLKAVGAVAGSQVVATVAGLLLFAPACIIWGIPGGLAASALAYAAGLAITIWITARLRLMPGRQLWAGGVDRAEASRIFAFYPMLIAHAALTPLATLLVRDGVIGQLDFRQAGLWQAAWRLSEVYTALITSSVSLYFMPRLGELMDQPGAMRREVWRMLALVVALTGCIALALLLTRDWVVRLVFASSFDGVQQLMPVQLMGDVLKMAAWTLGFVLVARVQTAWYVAIEVLVPVVFVLAARALVPEWAHLAQVGAMSLPAWRNWYLPWSACEACFSAKPSRHRSRSECMKWLYLLLFTGFALLAGVAGAVFGWLASVAAMLLIMLGSIFIDFRVGVLALLFLMPWQSSSLLPSTTGLNIINYLLALTVVSLLVGTLFSLKRKFVGLPKPLLLWYLLPITIGALLAIPHLDEAARNFSGTPIANTFSTIEFVKGRWIKPLFLVVFAWLLANAVRQSRKPERFVVALLLAAILPSIVVLSWVGAQQVSLAELQAQRGFMGPLGIHANEMAAMLCFAIGPALFTLGSWRTLFGRIFGLVCLALLLIGLILTFSRGGFVALIVMVAIYVIRQRQVLTFLACCVTLILAALFMPSAMKERLFTGVERDAVSNSVGNLSDPLTAGRLAVWERLLPEVAQSPLWGKGLGSTAWSGLVQSGIYKGSHPHNMYLAMLLDVGILGFAALAVWFVTLLRALRTLGIDSRQPAMLRNYFFGAFAALVGVMVFNVTNGDYVPKPEHTYLWFSVGMALAFWPSQSRAFDASGKPDGSPPRWRFGIRPMAVLR